MYAFVRWVNKYFYHHLSARHTSKLLLCAVLDWERERESKKEMCTPLESISVFWLPDVYRWKFWQSFRAFSTTLVIGAKKPNFYFEHHLNDIHLFVVIQSNDTWADNETHGGYYWFTMPPTNLGPIMIHHVVSFQAIFGPAYYSPSLIGC